ncbi:hypothetical protein CC80DRAFT_206611 [Byssothecium circinans]|uniref:FAM192A/Fyv6 N-terminal domain-containing protein n=1 Tax=Byssothecium circinans TaxID=147558 RepID=A0A6A5TR58_9PLEO|nr:hypothetical protein CC80DRAFT_206611 [Byssothecium circinans]
MTSNFISAGTTDAPLPRDAEWHAAQASIAEKQRLQAEQGRQQQDGKSLFDILQANKAAKQEAFEEAAKLKNQRRDDGEIEKGVETKSADIKTAGGMKDGEVKKDVDTNLADIKMAGTKTIDSTGKAAPVKPASASSPPPPPANALALSLGYASSDDDD